MACHVSRLDIAFTDSGRSSLRLAADSVLKNKKVLLPNFLCGIIPDILSSCGVLFEYYPVKQDLVPDKDAIASMDFDALYGINYFGAVYDWARVLPSPEIILIEDNVFLGCFEKNDNVDTWIGFNSFRKIMPVADGSIILSTIPLAHDRIHPETPMFSKVKYQGKRLKQAYLSSGQGGEEDYLNLLQKGERLLEAQIDIHRMSDHSTWILIEQGCRMSESLAARRKNYELLSRMLGDYAIDICPRFPSFIPLLVPDRDGLRRHLKSQSIFLPVHWPPPDGVRNDIYDSIISVPVDDRYDPSDMAHIATAILDYYN